MKSPAIHTSDAHRADRLWVTLGGSIRPIRRTGEKRYTHDFFDHPLRTNGRRLDAPAKLLSRINQLIRLRAASEQSVAEQAKGRLAAGALAQYPTSQLATQGHDRAWRDLMARS